MRTETWRVEKSKELNQGQRQTGDRRESINARMFSVLTYVYSLNVVAL